MAPRFNFLDKFAVCDESGSFVYKADACCNRWKDVERKDMENTRKDNWVLGGGYGMSAMREERRNINMAYELLARGVPKPTTEDLEEWIRINTGGEEL